MISQGNPIQLPRSRFNRRGLSSCLIVVAWLCASFATWRWLYQALVSTSRFHLILFSLIAVTLLVHLALRHRLTLSAPVFRAAPLLLMLGSAVGAIALNWMLDFEQLGVLMSLLGTYGLLGLFLSPTAWHKGLPAATLFACVVPFSLDFSSGLGFSARILTAHAVEHLLALGKISAISSHDIIVLENGIAQVDLPCSGLKSLWTGTVFLLAATWLEGRKIGVRWLFVFAASLGLLVGTNITRVLCLVVIIDVLGQPELGEMVHVSLGIISFAITCLITWGMLQWVPKHQHQQQQVMPRPASMTAQISLCAVLLGLAFVPHPHPFSQPLSVASVQLPSSIQSEPVSLSKAEQGFFAERPDTSVQKQRFIAGNLSGSMLMVASTSWQDHHSPELCFVSNGFKVDRLRKQRLSPSVLGRWLSINNGSLAAAYWFQTPQATTDDILVRFWQEITRQEPSWVLVSILFDDYISPNPEISVFTDTVSNAITQSFNGGAS